MAWSAQLAMRSLPTAALMVLCLWTWRHAGAVAESAGNSAAAFWAMRSGALAAGAAAQGLLVLLVFDWVYRRDWLSDGLKLAAALMAALTLVAAAAAGLASR